MNEVEGDPTRSRFREVFVALGLGGVARSSRGRQLGVGLGLGGALLGGLEVVIAVAKLTASSS